MNQVINVLQRPSGSTETGKYFLAAALYTGGAVASLYMPSLSRGSTPVSVTIDTTDQAPSGGMGTVTTGHLTANGFQVFSSAGTSTGVNAIAGGNYTIQY